MFNLQKTTKKIAALLLSMSTVFAVASCERFTVLQYRMEYGVEIFKVEVDGASMMQTLQNGEQYYARRTENGEGFERGDIIVVYVGNYEEFGTTEFLVKRLIAIEGDSVKCKDGQVEIRYAGETEWTVLYEPYAYYSQDKTKYDFAEYTVGEDEVFFLGDNRCNSLDSRYKEGFSRLNKLMIEQDVYGVLLDVEDGPISSEEK